ncbi:MAG: hypothetical protein VKL20_04640 [Synechocystis sp.]|nr:hypothetical protein [Synechocystis sp.]
MNLLAQTTPTIPENITPPPSANAPEAPSPPANGSIFDWIGYALRLVKSKPAEKINNQVQERYQGLIEKDELKDTINIAENAQLMKQLQEGKELDLEAIRADGSAEKLDQKLAMVRQFSDKLTGADQVATVGSETLDGGGSSFAAPFVFGGGLLGLIALLWWLKSLGIWSDLPAKLMGDEGLYQHLLAVFGKARPKVSESDVFLYNKALNDIEKIAQQAISIDNDKFSQSEFVLFAKVQYCFNNNSGSYKDLKIYLKRLQSAFKAQQIYTTLSQIEMGCMGSKQQTFYDDCHRLLQQNMSGEALTNQVAVKLTEMLPLVKTDTGKSHLESYADAVNQLAPDPTAIAIINRFKDAQQGDYATMKTIVEVMNRFKEADVSDLRTVMHATMAYYDDFEILGDIIDLPEEKRSPDTYARLLQYLALEKRHQLSFMQFQGLVEVLRQWHKPFRVLMSIRQLYPADQFRQPAVFKFPIPGLSLYKKHQNSLMDQRTGHSFIAFEDEEDTINDASATVQGETQIQQQTSLQLSR